MATTPTSNTAVATVEQFSEALTAGDVETAQALMSPDVVIDEPETLPYGGKRVGHEGFLAMLGEIGSKLDFQVLSREFQDAGPYVVAKMHTRWSRRGTDRAIETPYLELYTVRDGQITHVDIYPKDPGLIAELWD